MDDSTDPALTAVRIVAGTASASLARTVAATLDTECVANDMERFPDGELRPRLGRMRDEDVYVVQSISPPVHDSLVELLLLIDACRRAGAGRVTVVTPYFGYARQDRRTAAGEALGAKVVAEVITAAGADRVVAIDPHTPAFESMFAIPVEVLTAVPTLAHALKPLVEPDTVVVAPDLGAVKLAEHFGALLGLSVGIVRKVRLSGTTVRADELIGDVTGRPVLIVDDMISTGATIHAALQLLDAHGAAPGVVVAAIHGLFVGSAADQLAHPSLDRLVVTSSIARPRTELGVLLQVESLAQLLANAIDLLHNGQPGDRLLVTT